MLALWEYAKEISVYGDICCTMGCVAQTKYSFDNYEVQWETMWFLLFIRLATRSKALYQDFPYNANDLLRPVVAAIQWVPPSDPRIKWNVDDSSQMERQELVEF